MSDVLQKRDPLYLASEWHAAGHQVAIATVVDVGGSAPCPLGSHLVVRSDGHFEGSVSGGCVEADVLSEALDVIAGGKPRMARYKISNSAAWEVGLPCGGEISIYIEGVM